MIRMSIFGKITIDAFLYFSSALSFSFDLPELPLLVRGSSCSSASVGQVGTLHNLNPLLNPRPSPLDEESLSFTSFNLISFIFGRASLAPTEELPLPVFLDILKTLITLSLPAVSLLDEKLLDSSFYSDSTFVRDLNCLI